MTTMPVLRREAKAMRDALAPAVMALGIAALVSLGLPKVYDLPAPVTKSAPTDTQTPRSANVDNRYRIIDRLPSRALNHGDWRWDESKAPTRGPIFIAVDTATQTLSVWRGGHAIGVAVIVFGDERAPTPLGDFRIKMKDADHWSSTYDAPMPNTLRLTDDGISIHGSQEIAADLASHGCVGLPRAFAKRLFAAVSVGDPVRITNGVILRPGDILRLSPATMQPAGIKVVNPRT